ncbi:hypothetical protein JTB14_019977 [Gonioctena quinquepunctata]|nr:hypothetical protein JTB14_019977 [Gonioctena quinquepunctata]
MRTLSDKQPHKIANGGLDKFPIEIKLCGNYRGLDGLILRCTYIGDNSGRLVFRTMGSSISGQRKAINKLVMLYLLKWANPGGTATPGQPAAEVDQAPFAFHQIP